MIYVKKSSCPEDIQKDFDLQKAKPEWNDIPEEPNKGQARILREEFLTSSIRTNSEMLL